MPSGPTLAVFVHTGDRLYAGTDNTVNIIFHAKDGKTSKPTTLNNIFANDFERGQIDSFKIDEDVVAGLDRFVEIDVLEIWKNKTIGISDDWFVDKIVVENEVNNQSYVFPFYRWVKSDQHYFIKLLDTSLPQFDEYKDQRKKELEEKRKVYVYAQKIPNGPVQVKELPEDEKFSFNYKWGHIISGVTLRYSGNFVGGGLKDFKTIDDIATIYDDEVFPKPKHADKWNCDIDFGRKRLNTINPILIRRFTEIPKKFPVTDELLKPLLEGNTIQQAIDSKRLYWIDLKILEGLPLKKGLILCTPLLLMFVDKDKNLRPVAIQLFQEPGPDNPIFTPLDDPSLWTFVKMWYNNADCCYHQALTHLGLTHVLIEGVCMTTKRNLSPSHPIYKLLAPHFFYTIAINSRALESLVAPGGWVDKTMTYGATGLLTLAGKGFDQWRMNVEGSIPENIKDRGVDDSDALPKFYWRDDALLLYNAIRKYVSSYVDLYYTSEDMLKDDEEIQAFGHELAKERNGADGGLGIKGVPGNGVLTAKNDLIDVLTCVIYVSSCGHASANFGQYDEYAYQPNYPTELNAKPPTSKDDRYTDEEMCKALPKLETTQHILILATLLSRKGTNSLGDFEINYIHDPAAQKVLADFREDLKNISTKIKARNETVEYPFDDLLPELVPNAISI